MAYKTFNRFLKSLSIKKKLTYTLIPVILVTYLLSVGSVYMVSFHETKSIVNQQAQTLANQRTQLVDSYLDQLRTETEIFMFDTAFQKRFRTNRSTLSLSQQEELNKEITQYMYSMIISYNVYVESITLINNHLDSYNWHMDGRNSYSAYISRLLSLSDTLTELDGGILYTYDKLDQGVVTIARLIKDPIYDRKIGILMLDFNLGFLNKMTGVRTKDQSAADALLAIADQNGDIIYNDSPFSKDELFSVQNGSARLSADGRIDRSQQRRRDLDEADAAQIGRGGKARQIARHAAAERGDRVLPRQLLRAERVEQLEVGARTLGALSVREYKAADRQPGSLQTAADRAAIQLCLIHI